MRLLAAALLLACALLPATGGTTPSMQTALHYGDSLAVGTQLFLPQHLSNVVRPPYERVS